MNSLNFIAIVILASLTQSVFAHATRFIDPDKELLEELQYLKEEDVTIASRVPQKERDAPAILTVITEKEILNSGARDLIDVLRLIPGFDFGVDVDGVVGASIRGNWALEGGILLLIDGLEMNERLSGTIQLGGHYPIDNIDKIEVMRGPGSVMYGGFARLGVVNIITKQTHTKQAGNPNQSPKGVDGLEVTTRYGQMEKTYGHRGLSFYAGKQINEDAQFTVSGKASQAHRSDGMYIDATGQSLDLGKTAVMDSLLFNLAFRYRDNLTMRFILDDYASQAHDGETFISTPQIYNFKSYQFDTQYQQEFMDALKFNFHFNYSRQLPWQVDAFIGDNFKTATKVASTRYLGGLRMDYQFNDWMQLTGGVEFTHEEFEKLAEQYDFLVPKVPPIYENLTSYIEGLIKSDWGNLTLGLRYDKHNTFESNLSPRVALTKNWGDFHYKVLYSSAFRTPTLYNYLLDSTRNIKPEHTNEYEIELGYQLTKNLSLSTNAYYLSTRNKIVFEAIIGEGRLYNADSKINTIGVETELRWKQDWGYLTFNHSYSQMLNNFHNFKPIQQATNTLANAQMALAFPAHKFTLNGHYDITPSLSVNPSLIVTTHRYGYDRYDALGNLTLQKYSPEVLGNLYFRYQNALVKGLDLGVGVYNIFNTHQRFIQPYNSGHAPLSGQSREMIFKVSYHL